MLSKILARFLERPEEGSFVVANGIFRFYSELNSAFLVQEVAPFLLGCLERCERRAAGAFLALEGVRVA